MTLLQELRGLGAAALIGIIVLALAARFPERALKLGSRIVAVLPRISQPQAEQFLRPFVEGLAGVSDLRVFASGLILSLLAWLAFSWW